MSGFVSTQFPLSCFHAQDSLQQSLKEGSIKALESLALKYT